MPIAVTKGVIKNRTIRVSRLASGAVLMQVFNTGLPLDRQPIGRPEYGADTAADDVARSTRRLHKDRREL